MGKTWATNDKSVPGYDLLGRLSNWKKRGLLSGMAVEVIKQALSDGQDMHAVYDVRGKPEIVMNGEHYTAQEFQALIAQAQLAGGEEHNN